MRKKLEIILSENETGDTPERCVELMNKAFEVLEYEYPIHGFFTKREDGIYIFIDTNNNKNEKTEVTILKMYTENNSIYIDTEFYDKEIYEKYNASVIAGLLCDKFGRFYELSKKEERN